MIATEIKQSKGTQSLCLLRSYLTLGGNTQKSLKIPALQTARGLFR
jgi:hypothetical protein